jgi:hypothetical protein
MTLLKLEPATMNGTKLVAIILIAIGIIAFAYQGITYRTQDSLVNLGPFHVSAERSHTLPLPPVVGAIALLGGIALLLTGARKTA